MEKSTSHRLYLSGLALFIIGLFPWPIVAGDFGPALRTENALVLLVVGAGLSVTGYIGTLVNVARLSQWAWFALLLLFSAITMLAYSFAGPTESTGNAV